VSSGGLIYATIAILWAAVLIPMWLRNHDTAAENRSAERFGQAMRVLSRKEQEDADVAQHTDGDSAAWRESTEPASPAHPVQRAAQRPVDRPVRRPANRPARGRRTLAQRRARTLGVLAGLTALVTLAAFISPVPWWAPVPFVALLGAFVVHLRIQALQRGRRPGRAPRPIERPVAAEPVDQTPLERPTSGFVSGPSKAVVVETKGVSSSDEVTFEQDGEQGADGEETWRPNPLPLPTYVTAPKAVRPIKVIDLTTPGAWSSGRILDDDLADEDLLAAEVADEELDALLAQEAAPPRPAAEDKHENGEHGDAARRAVGD
jgi:hypothetical protein